MIYLRQSSTFWPFLSGCILCGLLYTKRLSLIGNQCLAGKYTKRPSRTWPPDRLLSSYFVNFNLSIASMCKDMIVHYTAQKVTEFTFICLCKDTALVIWKMLQQIIILRKAGGDGILGHCHNKVLPDPSRAGVTLCTHRALIALERGSACVRTFPFWPCVWTVRLIAFGGGRLILES